MSDNEREFPVLNANKYAGCPKSIPFEYLNEEMALKYHKQTLERLRARGGLCPVEIMVNIKKLPFSDVYFISEQDAVEFCKNLVADISVLTDFTEEFERLISKYKASLFDTNDDDGIHVRIGSAEKVVGFYDKGNCMD